MVLVFTLSYNARAILIIIQALHGLVVVSYFGLHLAQVLMFFIFDIPAFMSILVLHYKKTHQEIIKPDPLPMNFDESTSCLSRAPESEVIWRL
jgi:hypothetical protein